MRKLPVILFSFLFLASLLFAGARWSSPTRFPSPLVSSPVSYGNDLYSLSSDGKLYDVNIQDGGSRVMASMGQTTVPLQGGSMAFFAGGSNGTIEAFSLRTASILWQYPRASAYAYSSGALAGSQPSQNLSELEWLDYSNGTLYAVYKNRLIAFSEQLGAIKFERSLTDGRCASAGPNGIYVSDGDKVSAYSQSGDLQWSTITGPLYNACPTPIGQNVYVPGTRSTLLALNAFSGQTSWSYPLDGWAFSDPIEAGGSILIGEGDGTILSLNPQSGQLNWQTQIDGPVWANPLVITKGSQSIVVFGTHNNSIEAIDPQDGSLLFNYEVTDWVDHLSLADDSRTILAATRDNSLWAIYAYPICTIDYPRSQDIISQEITMRARAFSFAGISSVQIALNSKPQPVLALGGSGPFEYDLDLSGQPLSTVNLQCIAADSQGLLETDKMAYKSQPILSLAARKLNLTIEPYPKYPQPGQQVKIYVRTTQGYEAQDFLLEFMGKNYTASSPYTISAPQPGTYNITARKSGYYPAEAQISVKQDLGILPLLALLIALLAIAAAAVYFLKAGKKNPSR